MPKKQDPTPDALDLGLPGFESQPPQQVTLSLSELGALVQQSVAAAMANFAPAKTASQLFDEAVEAEEAVAPFDAPKQRMYTIMVDDVKGQPNFEKVGVNGKAYQIQRGVPVPVPEEVVEVLRNATETYLVEAPHPDIPGKTTYVPRYRCAIPWRIVNQ